MADRTIEIIIKGKNLSDETFDKIKTDLGEVGDAVTKTSAAMDYALGQVAYDAILKVSDAMADFSKNAINASQTYAQQVEDMARQTGASIEESSRLIQVADDMRVEFGELSSALRLYSTKQKEAGGSAIISTDAIAALSDQYLALGPGIQRTNFLIENFGRGGLAMAKLLEQGGDKIRSMSSAVSDNLIMTKDSIEANEDYRLTIDGLQDAWTGFNIKIGEAIAKNESLTGLVDTLAGFLDNLATAFTKLPEGVQTGIVAFILVAGAAGKLLPLLVGLKLLFGGAGIGGAVTALSGFITATLIPALAGAGAGIAAIGAPVILLTFLIGALIGVIIVFGKDALETAKMIGAMWPRLIVAAFQRVIYEAKKFVTNFINNIRTLANLSVNEWIEVGKRIPEALYKGIQAGWSLLTTQIKTLINSLLTTFKLQLVIKSPSKVFADEVGAPIAMGIAQGFTQTMSRSAGPAMARSAMPNSMGGGVLNRYQVGTIQVNNPLTAGERNWIRRNQENTTMRTLERIMK